MIGMMCMVRLVYSVSTDVFRDKVGVVVKIKDMIIQSRLGYCGMVMSSAKTSTPKYMRLWSLKP